MKPQKITAFLIIFFILAPGTCRAGKAPFGPKEASLWGSINYSVIGKYVAEFNRFKGVIDIAKGNQLKSVYLEIDVDSIRSNCSWCDQAVVSRRLLDAEKYPKMIFKSRKIIKDAKGYKVNGILSIHGMNKEMTFPFNASLGPGKNMLIASGSWVINRKDFDVTWNKVLDRAGVVVGNYITVDWEIKTKITH